MWNYNKSGKLIRAGQLYNDDIISFPRKRKSARKVVYYRVLNDPLETGENPIIMHPTNKKAYKIDSDIFVYKH